MRKNKTRARDDQEPVQTARVADFGAARTRHKKRKLKKLLLFVLPLAVLLVWFVGRNSAALLAVGDLAETVRIRTMAGSGWPQQTGITALYQWEEMTGGFVALGQESCAFYTDKGVRLSNVQAGYARPALSAGDTRFVLYNRGGTELRVEGRGRNLYTQNYPAGILLCEMGDGGSLAVVTDDPSYTAQLLVYPPNMEDPLTWKLTASEGVPMCMAFSPGDNMLAAATLSAAGGQTVSRVFLLDRGRQQEILLAQREGSLPLDICWLDSKTLLVVYDDGVAAYQEKEGEIARFDLDGHTLADYHLADNGHVALLLRVGSAGEVLLLDETLTRTARFSTEGAGQVLLTKTAVYTCTENAVTCHSLSGEYLWHQPCDPKAQRMLDADGTLLVFTGGSVRVCADPDKE